MQKNFRHSAHFECDAITPTGRCGARLESSKMDPKTFVDDEGGRVHRDTMFRKSVMMKDLDRTIDDFGGDLAAYNDHLEQVEDLVYDLARGMDVRPRIEAYKLQLRERCLQYAAAASASAMDVDDVAVGHWSAAYKPYVHRVSLLGPLPPATPHLPL
jgi:hypothetical protein